MNSNIKYALITLGAISFVIGPILASSPETKPFLVIPVLIFWWFIFAYAYEKYKFFKKREKFKKEKMIAKNPLLNMNTKELKNRAYAELISKNYILSIQFCNELVRRERGDYKVINIRAQCYLELNDLTSALGDAIASVEMQSDINLNEEGYRIRNLLTQGA